MLRLHPLDIVVEDLCCLYHRIISCIQTFLIYSQEDIYLILRFRYILSVSHMSTVPIVSITTIDLESPRLSYDLMSFKDGGGGGGGDVTNLSPFREGTYRK